MPRQAAIAGSRIALIGGLALVTLLGFGVLGPTWPAVTIALVAFAVVGALALRTQPAAPESPVVSSPQPATTPGDLDAACSLVEDLVLVFSARGQIRAANDAAAHFFGTGAAGLKGRSLEDVFPQPEIHELDRAARASGRADCEVAIAAKHGRRLFQVRAAMLPGGALAVVLRDVTDFQSALRLGGDFVSSVSHEMRTPLASIKAALETLEQSVRDDPHMTHRLLGMIDQNVDRLEALTSDILRLSQLETAGQPAERATVEIRPILDSIIALLEPLFSERRLKMETQIPDELWSVRTDARLFELILKNLLENAGKFAFEDSVIRIVATPIEPDATRWQVIDRGIGIPLDQQSRVFDRFYQVDTARTGSSRRRGTGLGLAIVQNAVRALGGTIAVESVWQQGTTMSVELPTSRLLSSPSRPNSSEAAWS